MMVSTRWIVLLGVGGLWGCDTSREPVFTPTPGVTYPDRNDAWKPPVRRKDAGSTDAAMDAGVDAAIDGSTDAALDGGLDLALDGDSDALTDGGGDGFDFEVDLAVDASPGLVCEGDQDCVAAVRLEACEICPEPASTQMVSADRCLVLFEINTLLFDYQPLDCASDCPLESVQRCGRAPEVPRCVEGQCTLQQ